MTYHGLVCIAITPERYASSAMPPPSSQQLLTVLGSQEAREDDQQWGIASVGLKSITISLVDCNDTHWFTTGHPTILTWHMITIYPNAFDLGMRALAPQYLQIYHTLALLSWTVPSHSMAVHPHQLQVGWLEALVAGMKAHGDDDDVQCLGRHKFTRGSVGYLWCLCQETCPLQSNERIQWLKEHLLSHRISIIVAYYLLWSTTTWWLSICTRILSIVAQPKRTILNKPVSI